MNGYKIAFLVIYLSPFILTTTYLILEVYQYKKRKEKRKLKEKLKDKEFGKITYGEKPKWKWHGKEKVRYGINRVFGSYRMPLLTDYDGAEIDIYLGSIMKNCDNANETIFKLEETVLHELTHWAEKHSLSDKGSRATDSNHSQRYYEVLKPIVNPEIDYKPYED